MLIIPAIDLKDGRVVRLYQGRMDKEKVYSDNPQEVAKYWVKEGARLIHIVDLEGAMSGIPKNIAELEKIVAAIDVPVEFGGGIRTEENIKRLLDIGVFRVTLSTMAFQNLTLLKELVENYKDRIIVSVDIKNDGRIGLKGWRETVDDATTLSSLAKSLSQIGINKLIYTDIERDGTLSGPRIDLIKGYLSVLSKYKISLILAGGISSLDDIKKVKELEGRGLEGLIIGKALYECKFTLSEALKLT